MKRSLILFFIGIGLTACSAQMVEATKVVPRPFLTSTIKTYVYQLEESVSLTTTGVLTLGGDKLRPFIIPNDFHIQSVFYSFSGSTLFLGVDISNGEDGISSCAIINMDNLLITKIDSHMAPIEKVFTDGRYFLIISIQSAYYYDATTHSLIWRADYQSGSYSSVIDVKLFSDAVRIVLQEDRDTKKIIKIDLRSGQIDS